MLLTVKATSGAAWCCWWLCRKIAEKSYIRNSRVKKISSEPDVVIKRATSGSGAIGSRSLLQGNVMELSKLLLTGYQFSNVRIPIEYGGRVTRCSIRPSSFWKNTQHRKQHAAFLSKKRKYQWSAWNNCSCYFTSTSVADSENQIKRGHRNLESQQNDNIPRSVGETSLKQEKIQKRSKSTKCYIHFHNFFYGQRPSMDQET